MTATGLANAVIDAAKRDNHTFSRFRTSSLEPLVKAIRNGEDARRVIERFDALPASRQEKYAPVRRLLEEQASRGHDATADLVKGNAKHHRIAVSAFEKTAPQAEPSATASKSLQKQYARQGVTSQEVGAVAQYIQGLANALNDALEMQRNLGTRLEPSLARNVANTESFIDKVAHPRKDPLFRVVRATQPLAALYERIKPGDVAMSRGFLSTSSSPGLVKGLKGQARPDNPLVFYQLDGVRSGADLGGVDGAQREVLVQRNTPFVVESVSYTQDGNALFIRLREQAGGVDPTLTPVQDMTSWDTLPLRESADGWTRVGGQQGSAAAGTYRDGNGQDWYLKTPGNPQVAQNEVLASHLYQASGVATPTLKLVTQEGRFAAASKIIKGLETLAVDDLPPDVYRKVGEGFVADAWLGNGDVAGVDNLKRRNGELVRVDVGEAMLFDSKGRPTGDRFGNEVTQLETFRDPDRGRVRQELYAEVDDRQIAAGIERIAAIPDDRIIALVREHGPGNLDTREGLAQTLIARKHDLVAQLPRFNASGRTDVHQTRL